MSQRGGSPSSSAPKGWLAKLDKKKLADAGLAALVTGLKGAKAVLDTSSVPGASAVFAVILTCIDEAQKASRNADILQTVRRQVDTILKRLEPLNTVPQADQDRDISQALKVAALDLVIDLSKQAEIVKEKTTHMRPAWMTRGSDEEALQDFVRAVEASLRQFQIDQGNRIERCLEGIKQETSAIREDVEAIKGYTREIKRRGTATEKETTAILESAQAIDERTKIIDNRAEAIDNTTSAAKALAIEEAAEAREREWDRVLDNLRQAPLASYDAERAGTIEPCSEATRVDLLKGIDEWIADPEADQVYWLKERAGFGKTAIALSVAERAAERGELAASFFFSHQVSDLNNASLLFPTLAFQLALFDQRRYRQLFAEAVKESPNAAAAKLKHQVQALFVKPLQRADSTTRPIVIVIDALDECQRDHAQELVGTLAEALQVIPLPIRLFVTSRPENHLIGAFKKVNISSRTIIDTSEDDVETYLRKELADIPRKLNMPELGAGWVSEEDIVTLVRRAGGLFVYGSTAIRFIGDPVALNPEEHLRILLLDDEIQTSIHQPFAPLDRLYTRVLDLATSGRPNLVDEVHVVLGGRIVIEETLTLAGVASLLGLKARDARRTLVKLQSVIVCPEADDGEVTFHHASFKDFLLDPSRSGETYFIDTSIHHHRVASQSMLMIAQSPYGKEVDTAMASEAYTNQKWEMKGIPPELNYAVKHVFSHVAKAQRNIALKNAFDVFSQQGCLWWLESVYGINNQFRDMVVVYGWMLDEGNAPATVVILNAFASLLPSDYNTISLHKCLALIRKALRRYFRISSENPEDCADVDGRVTSLRRSIVACVTKVMKPDVEVGQYDEARLPLETDWRSTRACAQLAEEMENILDEFQLSMGQHDEVEASRRHTQRMRSNLRRVLIFEHVIDRNDSESEGGPETSGDEGMYGERFADAMERRRQRSGGLPGTSGMPQSGSDDDSGGIGA